MAYGRPAFGRHLRWPVHSGTVVRHPHFIGYILGGPQMALVTTVAIFLPAFVLVAVIEPFVPRLRQSPASRRVSCRVERGFLGVSWRCHVAIGRDGAGGLADHCRWLWHLRSGCCF